VKTPFEFVCLGGARHGARRRRRPPTLGTLNNMGMAALFGMMPPTGYSMKADTWVNSSALLTRMNFSLGLDRGKVKGSKWIPCSSPEDLPRPRMPP
jgi:uncharacterized protein (DUF1800 family)